MESGDGIIRSSNHPTVQLSVSTLGLRVENRCWSEHHVCSWELL